jgi:hypothetical protein
MQVKKMAAFALAALLSVPQGFGWGSDGHQFINRAAALNMPADYPLFMSTPAAVDELEYLGPEPDRWRSVTEPELKNSQEPDHFINYELLAEFGPLPMKRFDFYPKLAAFQREQQAKGVADAQDLIPERVGMQPWIVAEVWGRLVVAFRQYRELKQEGKSTAPAEQAAILYAGWLGHYVGDASNPMHTTIHHNGWVGPNPNGYTTAKTTHSHFESEYVKANIKFPELSAGLHKAKAIYGDNEAKAGGWQAEWDNYLAYIKASNALVEPLYKLEKAGGFNGAGTPEGHKFVVDRLSVGAQMLSDMWYTAWIQSAVPLPQKH